GWSENTGAGGLTVGIWTPSLTTSTVPVLRKSSLSVFEPAVPPTSRARCFTAGKPASFLSIVATSGISEGMGRSLFRFPTTKPVAPRQTAPLFALEGVSWHRPFEGGNERSPAVDARPCSLGRFLACRYNWWCSAAGLAHRHRGFV